jgi:hypothetical protein
VTSSSEFKTDIVLGDRYMDTQTGVEGVATSIHFYQHACERVALEYVHPQQGLTEAVFDAPRLQSLKTGKQATGVRPGGPARAGEGQRGVPGR